MLTTAAFDYGSQGHASTSTADLSAPLDQDEAAVLARYREENPTFLAFAQTDERTRDMEEALAEAELERSLRSVQARVKARRQELTRQLESQPLPTGLRAAAAHPHQLRQDRTRAIREQLAVVEQQPCVPLAIRMAKEVAASEVPRNTLPQSLASMTAAFQRRSAALARRHLRYLERWATYCAAAPLSVQAEALPLLQARVAATSAEAAFFRDAHRRCQLYAEHTLVHSRRTGLSAAAGGTPATVAKECDDDARAHRLNTTGAVVEPLTAVDARAYFNLCSHDAQTRRRFDRFVSHAQLLPHSHRYDLYAAAVQALLIGDAQPAADGDTAPQRPAELPAVTADNAAVLAQLTELATGFGLTGHDRGELQEFLFHCGKKVAAVFAAQHAAWLFADGAAALPDLAPDTGSLSVRPKPPRLLQGDGAATLEQRAYLRPTTWTDQMAVRGVPAAWRAAQEAMLDAAGEVHPALRAEQAFLAETDALKARQRWREHSSGVQQRLLERQPVAAGDAARAGMMSQRKKGRAPQLDPVAIVTGKRMTATCELRYIRVREFRRRLLGHLNVLASTHRKIALDCRSVELPGPDGRRATAPPIATPMADAALPPPLPAQPLVVGSEDGAAPEDGIARRLRAIFDSTPAAAALGPTGGEGEGEGSADAGWAWYCTGDTRDDSGRYPTVLDAAGRPVMYQWALDALEALERRLLRTCGFFTARHAARFHRQPDAPELDWLAVLEDAYEGECWYLDAKVRLVDSYMEAYDNTCAPAAQGRLAQAAVTLIEAVPRLDLDAVSFAPGYTREVLNLELHHALLREMLTDLVADARSIAARAFGAPSEALGEQAAGPAGMGFGVTPHELGFEPEELHGMPEAPAPVPSQLQRALRPGTTVVGALELVPGLDVVAALPGLIEDAVRSVADGFHLDRHVLSHHTTTKAVLEAFLVSWRTLGAEDEASRVQHAARKAAAGKGKAPVPSSAVGPCVLDDFGAAATVVRDAASDAAAEAAPFAKKEEPQGVVPRPSPQRSAGPADVAGLAASLPPPPPLFRAFAGAADVVRLRAQLVQALYKTELLYCTHRRTAAHMGVGVRRAQLDPIDFDVRQAYPEQDAPEQFVPGGTADPGSIPVLVPYDAEYLPNLAAAEFDEACGRFDFATAGGARKILAFAHPDLRRALSLQLAQRGLLWGAVLHNEAALDAHFRGKMRDVWLATQDDDDAGETPFGQDTFVTGGGAASRPAPVDEDAVVAAARAGNRIVAWPELDGDALEAGALPKLFVSVNHVKSVHRKCVLAEMAARSTEAVDSKRPEQLRRRLKALKDALLQEYTLNLCNASMQFALRAEAARCASQLRQLSLEEPVLGRVLVMGRKADVVRTQPRSTGQMATDSRRTATCALARNGRFEEPRYIPHVAQILSLDFEAKERTTGRAAAATNTGDGFLDALRPHEHRHTHHDQHIKQNVCALRQLQALYHWLSLAVLGRAIAGMHAPPHDTLAALPPSGGGAAAVGFVRTPQCDRALEEVLSAASRDLEGLDDAADATQVCTILRDRHASTFLRVVGTTEQLLGHMRLHAGASSKPAADVMATAAEVEAEAAVLPAEASGAYTTPWTLGEAGPGLEALRLGYALTEPDAHAVPPLFTSLCRVGTARMAPSGDSDGGISDPQHAPLVSTHIVDGSPESAAPAYVSFYDDLRPGRCGVLPDAEPGLPMGRLWYGLLPSVRGDNRVQWVRELARVDSLMADDATERDADAEDNDDAPAPYHAVVLSLQRDRLRRLFAVLLQEEAAGEAGRKPSSGKAGLGGCAVYAPGPLDPRQLEDAYNRRVGSKVKVWAERELADRVEGRDGSGKRRQRHQTTTKDVRRLQCAVLVSEVNKMLIRRSEAAASAAAARVEAAVSQLQPMSAARLSEAMFSPREEAAGDPLTKEAIFTGFIALLTQRAVCVRAGDGGTAQYHIPEASLALALDTVGQRLDAWRAQVTAETVGAAEGVLYGQLLRTAVLERRLGHEEYLRSVDNKAVARRSLVAAADTNFALMAQNDALVKENRRLGQQLRDAEATVRRKVQAERDTELAALRQELLTTKEQYATYQKRLYREMQESLGEIKRSGLERVADMQSAPLHVKRQALRTAVTDDELGQLRKRNEELKQAVAKTRLFYEMRLVQVQAAHEQQLLQAQELSDAAKAQYWDGRGHHETEREGLRAQVVAAQSRLAQTELEVEQLRRDLQQQLQNKKDLVAWKVHHAKLLDDLTKKVHRAEQFGGATPKPEAPIAGGRGGDATPRTPNPDAERSRDSPRRLPGTAPVGEAAGLQREVGRLRSRLQREVQVKEQAFGRIDTLRQQVADSSETAALDRRVAELQSALDSALAENTTLRHSLVDAATPGPVKPSSASMSGQGRDALSTPSKPPTPGPGVSGLLRQRRPLTSSDNLSASGSRPPSRAPAPSRLGK